MERPRRRLNASAKLLLERFHELDDELPNFLDEGSLMIAAALSVLAEQMMRMQPRGRREESEGKDFEHFVKVEKIVERFNVSKFMIWRRIREYRHAKGQEPPGLYRVGRRNYRFKLQEFGQWLANGASAAEESEEEGGGT